MADDITRRTDDLEADLAALQFRKDPDLGKIHSQARPMPVFDGKITRRAASPAFPTAVNATVSSQAVSGGGDVDFTFRLESQGTLPDDAFTADILIHDGEVNGETPIGMGTDEYSLSVNFDGAFINLIITYDTTLLTITSMTFAVESDVADPELGTFRIEIGRVYLDYDEDTGHISNINCLNTQCGDINFQLIYGSFSGAPGIIPIATYSTFVHAALV